MTEISPASGGAAAAPCPNVAEVLKQVTEDIAAFEARKLPELKTELEAFVGKQQAVVTDYEKRYPALRRTWCDQQQTIECLYRSLLCIPDWKKIVAECICQKQHEVYCDEQRINNRKRCYQGARERARDEAQRRLTDAKTCFDNLSANADKIDAQLKADAGFIADIKALPPSEQAVALHLFFFKLLPAHKALTPDEVAPECKTFGDEEGPHKLCAPTWSQPCKTYDGECAPPAATDACAPPPSPPRRCAPWLLPPADYSKELDCAWRDYHTAKDEFATKDLAYKADPDDVPALGKALDEKKKKLEDEIKACLKKYPASDKCCTAEPQPQQRKA